MPKNLRHEFRSELIRQRVAAKRLHGRNQYKKDKNGRYADYRHIYSDQSYRTHLKRSRKFADFCKGNGVKKWSQITPNFGQKYLIHDRDIGLSASTISADALLINHLMIGRGQWKLKSRLIKHKISGMPKRSSLLESQRNKALSATEWQARYPAKYQRYFPQLETIRSFGFRRSELVGTKTRHFHDGFGQLSLYKFNDGSLRAFTVGKGGKIRQAICRKDKQQEMEKMYHNIIRPGKFAPKNVADFRHNLKENQPIFKPFSGSIGTHIWRADYAVGLLKNLAGKSYSGQHPYHYYKRAGRAKNGKMLYKKVTRYHNLNDEHTIGAYTAKWGAFYEVSRNLGHNRIDVLIHYLQR